MSPGMLDPGGQDLDRGINAQRTILWAQDCSCRKGGARWSNTPSGWTWRVSSTRSALSAWTILGSQDCCTVIITADEILNTWIQYPWWHRRCVFSWVEKFLRICSWGNLRTRKICVIKNFLDKILVIFVEPILVNFGDFELWTSKFWKKFVTVVRPFWEFFFKILTFEFWWNRKVMINHRGGILIFCQILSKLKILDFWVKDLKFCDFVKFWILGLRISNFRFSSKFSSNLFNFHQKLKFCGLGLRISNFDFR